MILLLLLSAVASSVRHHYYYLTCAAATASMLNDSGENVAPRVMTMVQRRKRGGAIAMRATYCWLPVAGRVIYPFQESS